MSSFADISESEFHAAIESDGTLRALQILQTAFTMGFLLFAVVVVGLHASGSLKQGDMAPVAPDDPDRLDILPILTLVHAAVAISCWTLAFASFGAMIGPARLARAIAEPMILPGPSGARTIVEGPAHKCIALLRGAILVRLALIEGPALFGAVICLLGAIDGSIDEQPLYWLNLLSGAVLVLFAIATFPTRDRLWDLVRRRFVEIR